ncbi:MAG: dTMP kinase [Caedibacter sp. 37-49]|nr:MAG: dTMP kinase [Caedibacter sp. 37-49]
MGLGKFITLEGGEGAGKTTQAKYIKEFLQSQGKEVLLTREPGGSTGAELIRNLLVDREAYSWDALTEYLLFTAARRDHILQTIKPALEEGIWVICDRFYDSSLVYQGYVKHVALEKLETIYKFISEGIFPDLTLILNIAPEVGLKRAQKRSHHEDRFEQMGLHFHKEIQKGFLAIAESDASRCKIVEAEGEELQIKETILTIVQKALF